MENILYQNIKYARVTNQGDFFKSKLPEMIKVRGLYDSIKILFGLSNDKVLIDVAENGDRIYKFTLINSTVYKDPFGCIFYLPLVQRLDIYSISNMQTPLIQWKNKKVVYKGYNIFLDKVDFHKLFDKLINSI